MALPSLEQVKKMSPEERREYFKLIQECEADDLKAIKAGFIERIQNAYDEALASEIVLTSADVPFIRGVAGKAGKSVAGATRVAKFFYRINGNDYKTQGKKSQAFLDMKLTPEQLLKATEANPDHPDYVANKKALDEEKKGGVAAKKAPAKAPVKVAKKAPVK
ncbi:MAG: hypothetical protein WC617_14025 [Rhodanobacter sp.]|jgi:hypothetical protein